MPVCTLAKAGAKEGTSVVSAVVRMGRVGAWTADLVLNGPLPTGKLDLLLGSNRTLTGTATRAGVLEGLTRVRLVAGADGIREHVKPKHYTSPSVGVVWRDLLGDVGETPAPSADAGILAFQLEHWTTMQMSAGRALRCLLPIVGEDVAWRHLPDGTIWTGRETWPDGGVRQFAQVDGSPEDAAVEVSLLEPTLLPGTRLGDWKIDDLEMLVDGGSVRARILLAD